MKTIGLLGGMSWESTLTYYRLINEAVKHFTTIVNILNPRVNAISTRINKAVCPEISIKQ